MKKKIGSIRHFWSVFVVLALLASMVPVFMLHSPSVVQAATTNNQLLMAGAGPMSTSATVRTGFVYGQGWGLNFGSPYRLVVSTAGTFQSLCVEVSVAPGGAASRSFTLYKNGASTSLTCTISAANTTASDANHTVSVVAGDYIDGIESIPSSSPAAANGRCSVIFVASTAKFTSGVQHSHHNFQCRFIHGWMHIHRDTAPVIIN